MKKILCVSIFLILSIVVYSADSHVNSEPMGVVKRIMAVESALSNNPAYLAAIESHKSAKYSFGASISEFLPTVSVRISSVENEEYRVDPVKREVATLSADYNIFNGFRSYNTVRISGLNLDIMSASEREAMLTTIKDVNLAFQNVLRTGYLRKSAQTLYESAKLVLDESELKQQMDLITRADLYSARADKEKAYSSFLDTETNYNAAVLRLSELTGLNISFEAEFTAGERVFEIKTLDEYMKLALDNNIALQQSSMNAEIARRNINTVLGSFLPTVTLSASRNWDYSEQKSDYDSRYEDQTYGISATWYIFSGFGDSLTAISNAKNYNSALHKVTESKNALIRQVNVAYMNAKSSFEKVSSSKAYLAAATENYTAMQEMYRIGRASLKDNIDARKILEDAQSSLAEADYSMVEAFETLAVLTGTVEL